MTSADMLLVYANGKGNVTLSPRFSSGHEQPTYDANIDTELLEGSGIANGVMTANIRCGNCARNGKINFGSTSGTWIHARQSGSPLNTEEQQATITEHTEYGVFTWDFTPAVGGESTNPFTNANSNQITQSTSSADNTSSSNRTTMILAHGILASLAFLILFPVGAILIRLASFPSLIWIHAGIQLLAWVLFIVAFSLALAYTSQSPSLLSDSHPIIGFVLVALTTLQPLTGWLHHRIFLRTRSRSVASYTHLWVGRVAIVLGMINGGLGLKLAGTSTGYVIAYSVVAGVMGTAYIASAVLGEAKRGKRAGSVGSSVEKATVVSSEKEASGTGRN